MQENDENDENEMNDAQNKSGSAGFTFMEIMIVIAIVAMVAAGVIVGLSTLSRSKLRSSAYLMAAAAQRAFSYSTTRNESVRLVLNLDENILLFESTEDIVLIDKDKLKEEEEEEEEEEESGKMESEEMDPGKFSLGVDQLSERIKAGFHKGEVPRYKPPSFQPIGERHLSEKNLENGVKFYAVYSQLYEEEKREGKAYVYFFPDGTADHTVIQVQGKSGEIYTVEILPYSAKVRIYNYPYIPAFEDDEEEEL